MSDKKQQKRANETGLAAKKRCLSFKFIYVFFSVTKSILFGFS